jgi:hypothetical protein
VGEKHMKKSETEIETETKSGNCLLLIERMQIEMTHIASVLRVITIKKL